MVRVVSNLHFDITPNYSPPGAVKLLHFPLSTGIPTIITPRFDPVTFCAHIARYKCTVSLVVPPVLVVLVRHPGEILTNYMTLSKHSTQL